MFLTNPVDVTETGNLTAFDPPLQSEEAAVWTGTDPNGTIDSIDSPSGYMGSSLQIVFGNADDVAGTWMFQGTVNNSEGQLATEQAFVYGLSNILTVQAVPENRARSSWRASPRRLSGFLRLAIASEHHSPPMQNGYNLAPDWA